MKHISVLRFLYLYYRTYSCISDLIRVLQNIYLSYGSYTCVTELILGFRILYLYYGAYPCTSNLIRSLFSYFGYGGTYRYYRIFYLYKSTRRYYRTYSLYRGTRRYYWTYTYFSDTGVPVGTTELMLILLIREYPWVLHKLIRYRSTRRYYRIDTEVHSDLYSYFLFRVLSYNCLTTRPIIRNE